VDPFIAAVVGQLARHLVLTVEEAPRPGAAADAIARREVLGGKGADQAVALAQLGARPALVAVAGDDMAGDAVLAQARRDGIDTSAVIRRRDTETGLIVEIFDGAGRWRYVQHLPDGVLLHENDILAAEDTIAGADAVLVQLQQPAPAAAAAARIAADAGRLVVLDGAPPASHRAELLAAADVVRADAHDAGLLLGVPVDDAAAVRRAAADLLDAGPSLLAIGLEQSNLFVWAGAHLAVPRTGDRVVDPSGGGDAFVAALTVALLSGLDQRDAARCAVAAPGVTAGHAGGRPRVTASIPRSPPDEMGP
jgi:ribokinase